jgi:hypothetical protein
VTEPANQDATSLSTGDAAVDQAVAKLDELDDRDLSQHAEVYEEIHESLRAALDEAGAPNGSQPPSDSQPGASQPPRGPQPGDTDG